MLDKFEAIRFDRQIMISQFGEKGQEKLKKSRILIVGVGGLGSAAAFYLAAAGVGSLRVVDKDQVELSNLNRQILHWEPDIDRPKVESAGEKLSKLNSRIELDTRMEEINDQTLPRLLEGCDLVLDGLDNFNTRYLVNQHVVPRKIPLFTGESWG